jgi:hypothetical protein
MPQANHPTEPIEPLTPCEKAVLRVCLPTSQSRQTLAEIVGWNEESVGTAVRGLRTRLLVGSDRNGVWAVGRNPESSPPESPTGKTVRTCRSDVLATLASGRRLTLAGVLAALVVRDLDRWPEKEVRLTLDGLLQAGRVDHCGATPPRGFALAKATPADAVNVGNDNGQGAVRPARATR